jgi:hypothetical protein
MTRNRALETASTELRARCCGKKRLYLAARELLSELWIQAEAAAMAKYLPEMKKLMEKRLSRTYSSAIWCCCRLRLRARPWAR